MECETTAALCSFLEKLLVEEEDEQVDVDLGLVKHLHHCHALVLKLQEVLLTHTHTHTLNCTVWPILVWFGSAFSLLAT